MAFPIAALVALVPAFVAAANPDRKMNIKNSCSAKAYIMPVSGAAGDCSACPSGSTCNTDANVCYWDNATPSLGDWSVPAGQTTTITYASSDNNITWSGNYAFGLEGTTLSADDATCASQGCRAAGPYNQAEFTLAWDNVDWYDISNIGGINVPMSITPDQSTAGDGSNGYSCGDTGAPTPKKEGLGASSWKLEPPSAAYNWVSGGSAAACSSASDCSDGETCGNVFANGAWSMVCGTLSGYWTENAICGYGVDAGIVECTAEIDNGSAGTTTLAEMQGCGGTSGSCYSEGADDACCGGAPWTPTLGNLIVEGTTHPVNKNSVWMENILHTLHWIKAAAPNAYTYPYDDVSSTFTCSQQDDSGVNAGSYTIELCPGGLSI